MKARQLLCVHTWAEGLTAMEEETCACSRCGLPYETWCVRARAVRIGLLLATLIPATLAERIQAQPWHAVAITVATACGCLLAATFL